MNNELVIIDEVSLPKRLTFLLVEDEPDIQELLIDTLIDIGFTGDVKYSNNAEMAVDICLDSLKEGKKPIDFIISDWNLIGMSGLDFLIKLRSNNAYKNTPFLMVTGNDDVSGILAATNKGASEYLVKPWDQEELAQKIAMCWDKRLPNLP